MADRQTKIKVKNKINKKTWLGAVVLALFFIFGHQVQAQAASLYFSPSAGSYTVGKTFSTAVYVSSADQAINAVSGVIRFPSDLLEVTSVSKSGSVLTFWVQEPSYSNSNGEINFEGIVMNPGFTGTGGKIITITFKTKTAGVANLSLGSGSVLANDGQGTNIINSLGTARFNIEAKQVGPAAPEGETPSESVGTPPAPKIESSTHPDPNAWYANNNPEFSWVLAKDITSASLLVSNKPQDVPSINYTPAISSKSLAGIDDGAWYLHIRLRNKLGWGGTTHYRFQIDRTNPEYLNIKMLDRANLTEASLKFIFDAFDAASGIEKYEIQMDNNDTIKWIDDGSHVYTTESLVPGRHTMIVKAIDRAGNFVANFVEFNIEAINAPVITYYPTSLTSKDIFLVKGETYTNAKVFISIRRDHDEPQKFETQADENGKFTFVADDKLSDGIYHFWAEAMDSKGARSLPTQQYRFMVEQPKFIRIGSLAISFLSVIISLIALLLGLVMFWGYSMRKAKTISRRVKKETVEASTVLHQEFHKLKDNVKKQLTSIECAGKKRALTKEEAKLLKKLSADLTVAEDKVAKEISDIKKQV